MNEDLKQKKIECIKVNKQSAVNALTAYLDSIYDLTDKYFETKIEDNLNIKRILKTDLKHDEKLENFLIELESDATKFEAVRNKIMNNDWDLSLAEISRVGLGYLFICLSIDKQKKMLIETEDKIKSIFNVLMERTQNVDLSEKN